MTKHKNKRNKNLLYLVLGIVILTLIVITFIYYTKQTTFNLNSYAYTSTTTYQNYTINYYSTSPFNDTFATCTNSYPPPDIMDAGEENNIIPNTPLSMSYSATGYDLWRSSDRCDGPANILTKHSGAANLMIINKTFKFLDLDNLLITFSGTGTTSWNTQWLDPSSLNINNYLKIYLSNNQKDILIYSYNYPNGVTTNNGGTLKVYKDNSLGRYFINYNSVITPFDNITDENETFYITVESYTGLTNQLGDFGSAISQSFIVSDLQFNYKNSSTCQSKSCLELNASCGPIDNGCGAYINCGACSSPQICSNNQCVTQVINPNPNPGNGGGGGASIPAPTPTITPKNTTPSISTCWKINSFIPQTTFNINNNPCRSYLNYSCGNDYTTQDLCSTHYNSEPIYTQIWQSYGLYIIIISVILLIIAAYFIIKLNKKFKKKR